MASGSATKSVGSQHGWVVSPSATSTGSSGRSQPAVRHIGLSPYLARVASSGQDTRQLAPLDAADLDRLYLHLLTGGRADHAAGQGLSPRTVRYVATILGRALKDAVRKGLIPRSPHADADAPRPSAGNTDVMRTWTGKELGSFLDSVEDHRMGALFTFLALTGCRRGEALGLRWSDLDLSDTGARAAIVQTVGRWLARPSSAPPRPRPVVGSCHSTPVS